MDGIDDLLGQGGYVVEMCHICHVGACVILPGTRATCASCQSLLDQGYSVLAIEYQMAARIGYIAVRDGIDPDRAGIGLGWDGRWHFIGAH